MRAVLMFLFATVASAVKINVQESPVDMMSKSMQVDNEADMWKDLMTADPKDIIDGDLV